MDCVSKLHYHCPVCSGVFTRFIIFEGHLTFSRQCRENIGSYMQGYACKREFKHLAALKYHLQHQQQECLVVYEAKEKNNFNFINENSSLEVCDVNYGGTAGSDVARQTHVSEELKLKSFYCGVCGKGFTTKIDLIQHSATHFTGTVAVVNKNKSQTSHARTLTKLKVPLDRSFHQCQENHRKIHGNVVDEQTDFSLLGKIIEGRVNQCRLCKAKFALYCNLKRHMTVHTFGTISCDICKVMFTRNSLIWHQKVFHSNNIKKIVKRNQTSPSNLSLKRKNIEARGYQCGLCKVTVRFLLN
ncbi:zinc finger protein 573-like [Bradysia coprophila]|uniref:zinc finger protein 573-like n=1 Tax=Bradysia coprophila TaxID=38358 RepID=UPI00187D8085|nr:zinc finger protein 573-like [Bradysia coprophila]